MEAVGDTCANSNHRKRRRIASAHGVVHHQLAFIRGGVVGKEQKEPVSFQTFGIPRHKLHFAPAPLPG